MAGSARLAGDQSSTQPSVCRSPPRLRFFTRRGSGASSPSEFTSSNLCARGGQAGCLPPRGGPPRASAGCGRRALLAHSLCPGKQSREYYPSFGSRVHDRCWGNGLARGCRRTRPKTRANTGYTTSTTARGRSTLVDTREGTRRDVHLRRTNRLGGRLHKASLRDAASRRPTRPASIAASMRQKAPWTPVSRARLTASTSVHARAHRRRRSSSPALAMGRLSKEQLSCVTPLLL